MPCQRRECLESGDSRGSAKEKLRAPHRRIGKSNTWLRKTVADLKKRLSLLEKENKWLDSGD